MALRPIFLSLVIALTLSACDTTPSVLSFAKEARPQPADFDQLGVDHNAAMDYGTSHWGSLSASDKDSAAGTSSARNAYVVNVVDPFMAQLGYDVVAAGNAGLEGRGQATGRTRNLSPEADVFIAQIDHVIDTAESSEYAYGPLRSIENAAVQPSISNRELDAVLSTSAVALASFEYWEGFFGGASGGYKQMPQCVRGIIGADAMGALWGAFGGPGGAGAGAARGSLIAYISAAHQNLCG